MIEFNSVSRSYGRKVAVDNLSLTIPAGQLFALLGPNGAGKTTTIKLMVGLLRPAAGTICLAEHDVVQSPREALQSVGYVPDEPYLYEKLSGREFLHFVAEMRGLSPQIAAERIARESDYFDLGPFLDSLTETYSHGMKQRIVFASAMLHDPPVLVLDEPMVGLDPRNARLVKDLLRARAAAGTTVFLSTHTLSLAEEIADRIGILESGRLSFLGTVADLQREMAAPGRPLEALFLQLTEEHSAEKAPARE